MMYLLVSLIAALAVSISVFVETSSLLLAFLAYSAAGMTVLMTVLFSTMLALRAEDKLTPHKN